MDEAQFAVLERAIDRGGENLSAKDLASGKAGKAVLESLRDEGLLVEAKKKYSLTPEGRAAWERHATPARRRIVEEAEERKRQDAIAAFLPLVEKRGEKPWKAGDLEKHAAVIALARERKLIRPGEKENSFELLPAGREFLLSQLPHEEQVATLRQMQEKLATHWNAVRQRFQREIEGLGEEHAPLGEELKELRGKVQASRQALDHSLDELHAFARLVGVAQGLKDSRAIAEASLQRLEEGTARLNATETNLRRALEEQRAELERFREMVERRLGEVGETEEPAEEPEPEEPEAEETEEGAEPDVWEVTREVHDRIRRANLPAGGIVTIPELADEVTKQVPGLSAEEFRDRLLEWQDEDRITLQVCTDRELEPRADEGIDSPRGLLFYVQMNSEE